MGWGWMDRRTDGLGIFASSSGNRELGIFRDNFVFVAGFCDFALDLASSHSLESLLSVLVSLFKSESSNLKVVVFSLESDRIV